MFEKIAIWLSLTLRARFVRFHGEGEAHQYDVYRCESCSFLFTWNMIRRGEKCPRGHQHMVPSEPSFLEGVRLLLWKS